MAKLYPISTAHNHDEVYAKIGEGGVTDHGLLTGLEDNDHPQYLLTTGKAADSDKLDGVDSTGFATAGHDHNAAYLGITAKAADSDKLDGLDSSAFLQEELSGKRSETDLDNNLTAGVFWWTNTDTHTPVSGWGWCLVLVSDGTTHNNVDNWIAQVSFCTTTMKIYYRQKVNNGAWSAWVAFTGT